MKNKILFINACVRESSRTEELARYLSDRLDGEITEISLYKENLSPIEETSLEKRNRHDFSGEEFMYAKQFQCADTIVIAAPLWDLSFPAVLKIYLENITVSGLTFEYSKEGRPVGKCNAKELYYITTSGGYIGKFNFGFDYVSALSKGFFGIGNVKFFSAEGLDIYGADVAEIMQQAKKNILI